MYNINNQELDTVLNEFIELHSLKKSYIDTVHRWYFPQIQALLSRIESRSEPLVIGINGCQGSGKSTLADLIVHIYTRLYEKKCVAISIDDFYLTLEERKHLADRVHPLFLTRGVPGTHDVSLATSTLNQLSSQSEEVKVPRFNKALDDRYDENEWTQVEPPADVIVLEGWCLGATAQNDKQLKSPVNELEEFEDRSGIWRDYVNQCLQGEYQKLFSKIDYWMMLKAPSFESVFEWRLEQERKLETHLKSDTNFSASKKENSYSFMSPQQIRRFIQYYQRITEHLLDDLPDRCDCVFDLGKNREVQAVKSN